MRNMSIVKTERNIDENTNENIFLEKDEESKN